jgi:hypothetical protein
LQGIGKVNYQQAALLLRRIQKQKAAPGAVLAGKKNLQRI